MTATLDDVTNKKPEALAEAETAKELVRLAREQGLSLTGPDGLLKQLTRQPAPSPAPTQADLQRADAQTPNR